MAANIVKTPSENRPVSAILRFKGSIDRYIIDVGTRMIIKSEDILNAICILEYVAYVAHCELFVGTAQYWENGLQRTA